MEHGGGFLSKGMVVKTTAPSKPPLRLNHYILI